MKSIFTILCISFICQLYGQRTELAEAILQNLISARAGLLEEEPTLRIIERKKNIAAYSPVNNEIVLEKKAVDICMSLPPPADTTALAFLIGHEFTHFLQRKIWKQVNRSSSFFVSRKELEIFRDSEAEADKYGAFLSYLAGYYDADAVPILIDTLYSFYRIEDADTGYPSQEERKKLSSEVCGQVNDLIAFFEGANYLSQLGQYEWSQILYHYIGKFIQHKEIDHNQGINQLKYYLSFHPSYSFPVNYKPSLQIRDGMVDSPDSILEAAITSFTNSIIKDPVDYDSYLHLAMAYALNKKIQSAEIILQEISGKSQAIYFQERCNILQSILDAMKGKKKIALERLKALERNTHNPQISSWCRDNFAYINGVPDSREEVVLPEKGFFPVWEESNKEFRILDDSDPVFPVTGGYNDSPEGRVLYMIRSGRQINLYIKKMETLINSNFLPTNELLMKSGDNEILWIYMELIDEKE